MSNDGKMGMAIRTVLPHPASLPPSLHSGAPNSYAVAGPGPLPLGEGEFPTVALKCRMSGWVQRSRARRFYGIRVLAAGAVLLALMYAGAQQIPIAGTMSDFSSVQYFDPPYQQRMKSRISGVEAQQLTDDLWLIKQVKIEKFDVSGKLQLMAEAPECVYDRTRAVAHSPGKLQIRSGDGQVRVEGEGFLWRQDDSWLIISNQAQTVIEKPTAVHP